MKNKVLLLILDGFGLSPSTKGNAIVASKMTYFNELLKDYPAISLETSGPALGLPPEAPGNSQTGHQALGTGQAVMHNITLAERDIKSGSFFDNQVLKEACKIAKERSSKVHLVGLLSDVPVHASEDVLHALIELVGRERAQAKLFLHLFLDGRDTRERSGQQLVERLYLQLRDKGYGNIATLVGRYFAMDRDGHWDRINKAWELLVNAKGQVVRSALEGVVDAYGKGQTDEFLDPLVINAEGKISKGDVVILFNSRPDRMRELTQKFASSNIEDLHVVAFSQYYQPFPFKVIYPATVIEPNLVSYLNEHNKKVCKITETERYAHLTYFFNGGVENPYSNEDRFFQPSIRQTDLTKYPAMAIKKLTSKVTNAIEKNIYDLIIVNIPNADSMGHTGNMESAQRALAEVDVSLSIIVKEALAEYTILLTSDHGNCEYMIDEQSGERRKEDTSNPVPLVIIDQELKGKGQTSYIELASNPATAVLTDVPSTILSIMQVPPSPQIGGVDIIKEAIIT